MRCADAILACLVVLAGCSRTAPPPEDETARTVAATPTMPPLVEPAGKPAVIVPRRLAISGEEGSWSAEVDGDTLVYRTPDYPAGVRISVARKAGPGGEAIAGTIDGKPLLLTVGAGPCSDGKRGRILEFIAERRIGPDIAPGCATPR